MRTIYVLLMVVPVALVVVLMSSCGPAATGGSLTREQATRKPTEDAKPLSVAPKTAVYYAVKYSRMSSPGPGPQLVGDPTEARGRVMTYAEADKLTRPAAGSASAPHWSLLDSWTIGEERDRLVWLIEVRDAVSRRVLGRSWYHCNALAARS